MGSWLLSPGMETDRPSWRISRGVRRRFCWWATETCACHLCTLETRVGAWVGGRGRRALVHAFIPDKVDLRALMRRQSHSLGHRLLLPPDSSLLPQPLASSLLPPLFSSRLPAFWWLRSGWPSVGGAFSPSVDRRRRVFLRELKADLASPPPADLAAAHLNNGSPANLPRPSALQAPESHNLLLEGGGGLISCDSAVKREFSHISVVCWRQRLREAAINSFCISRKTYKNRLLRRVVPAPVDHTHLCMASPLLSVTARPSPAMSPESSFLCVGPPGLHACVCACVCVGAVMRQPGNCSSPFVCVGGSACISPSILFPSSPPLTFPCLLISSHLTGSSPSLSQ